MMYWCTGGSKVGAGPLQTFSVGVLILFCSDLGGALEVDKQRSPGKST